MGVAGGEDEQRKQITSALRNGDPVIFFDNANQTVDSSAIARALTASTWEDRILGISRTLRVPIRNSWVVTANNLTLSVEIARRCYWVRLDARVEKPWERDLASFTHPDLRSWAKENRANILGAFLTLGRNWFVKRCPVPEGVPTLGSFESWSKVMAGVLDAAGIEGFLQNADQLYEKTTDSTGLWSTFVAAWHDEFADKKMTAAELAAEIRLPGNQALREALPEDLSPNDENLARKLGNHFKKQQGVRYGTLYIDKRGEKKRSALWMVVDGGDDRDDGNQIRLIDIDGSGESDESGESAGASPARTHAHARGRL